MSIVHQDFIYNKWFSLYSRIIEKQYHIDSDYEIHHIVPRSAGGSCKSTNLVKLPYLKHYQAHRVLLKCTKGALLQSMKFAFARMTERYQRENINTFTSSELLKAKSLFKETNSKLHKNKVSVIGSDGVAFKVDKSDERYINNDLIAMHKGMTAVRCKLSGQTFKTDKFDPTIHEGITAGKVVAKHTVTGEVVQLSKQDPRYISGEFVGVNKGRIQKPYSLKTCPHCNTIGKGGAMNRWHFDNCKMKGS